MATLLESVVQRLRGAVDAPISYGRAAGLTGVQVVVTQDETPVDARRAERGLDIDIFAPGPDPAAIESARRDIVDALHYALIGNTDDAGAVRVFLRDQSDVDDDEDWAHWSMRFVARFAREQP
jgi:hypothetical protein